MKSYWVKERKLSYTSEMGKIISIFKQLLKDKRGKEPPVMGIGFYRATKQNYKKFVKWLNIEKIVLDKISLENMKLKISCMPAVHTNAKSWISHGLAYKKLNEYYQQREKKTDYNTPNTAIEKEVLTSDNSEDQGKASANKEEDDHGKTDRHDKGKPGMDIGEAHIGYQPEYNGHSHQDNAGKKQ